jgi:hypothetical protein
MLRHSFDKNNICTMGENPDLLQAELRLAVLVLSKGHVSAEWK